MASDIPQLMSSGSMLGIGQKLDLNVPYFESNYSCLFVDSSPQHKNQHSH